MKYFKVFVVQINYNPFILSNSFLLLIFYLMYEDKIQKRKGLYDFIFFGGGAELSLGLPKYFLVEIFVKMSFYVNFRKI